MLLGSVLGANAQAPRLHPTEVGLEGARYAAISSPTYPRFQAFSGVVLRYMPQRLGVRAGLAYSHRTNLPEIGNCADCVTGETSYRRVTLRAGAQYIVLPNTPWLYPFLDVAYRNTGAAGRFTGGFCGCLDNTFTATTRAIGGMGGVGARFRIFSRLFFGPEVYYEGFVGQKSS